MQETLAIQNNTVYKLGVEEKFEIRNKISTVVQLNVVV